ncbi:hypothetical protein GWR56_05025 [Mucilaginibacter sp. 14171R-50]|uniref:hypothetical protein n=1 Tax=Mucilaginibacter sp. 14171R-50 TaxID=2703789 RepID=UPI00138B7D95|nr:hypothetical protein [Mucilaginibacter sp. 14171R-50]QHS54935.1 hypothetical protein GWR56_05025 [Mucilaginibacter sp. 14171R-50]
MKKTLSVILASAMLMLGACTKEGSTPSIPNNSWTLNGIEHLVKSSNRTTNGANAEAAISYKDSTNKAAVAVGFKALPTAGGTYQLVASDGGALTDNQCHLSIIDDNGKQLSFTGEPTPVEVIVLQNNKLLFKIPTINVATEVPGTTYKFKAALYELRN